MTLDSFRTETVRTDERRSSDARELVLPRTAGPVEQSAPSEVPAGARVAEWRHRRLAVHLAALREPLHGLDLDNRDHAVLAWLADHETEDVGAVVSLLTRARAAEAL